MGVWIVKSALDKRVSGSVDVIVVHGDDDDDDSNDNDWW